MTSTTLEIHKITSYNAEKIWEWFETRGGIAIWPSIDLSDLGTSFTTPLDGQKPHWKCAAEPARTITDPDDVEVQVPREYSRFRVGIRPRGNGLGFKVTDGGTRRIRARVAKATEKFGDAWHEFDYETQEAVILVPEKTVSLREYIQSSRQEESNS